MKSQILTLKQDSDILVSAGPGSTVLSDKETFYKDYYY